MTAPGETQPLATAAVSRRLVAFVREQLRAGVPDAARHEAKRLVLNQLKASVAASDHPAVRILGEWRAGSPGADDAAHVLWLGQRTTLEHAAMVNAALFEVLDFHDTYIPTYLHAVSGVLPAALALAESTGCSGEQFVTALALGIEVELAVATILMPTGYFRGFVPLGLVGGVGAAVACAILGGLDADAMQNAIGLAMCTAGGTYESVGSMGLAYVSAINARNGLDCAELAGRGFDAPATAFEGDKGMLASYSDEPAAKIEPILRSLGEQWRILRQSYKTIPTETITHAPVECVLELRQRCGERTIASLRLGVQPIVVTIADERFERFGVPTSDLEARFDLRFCVAAAWLRGQFTLGEMSAAAYTDPEILATRAVVELVADDQRGSFDGCWLEVGYTDGSSDTCTVDAFRGSADNPLTDEELGQLFTLSAGELLSAEVAAQIVETVMTLDTAADVRALMTLARLG